MAANTLVIRADASIASGTGHVMRCLAIAQAWRDAGGDVQFAIAESTVAVGERLRSEEMTIIPLEVIPGSFEDVTKLLQCMRSARANWIVLDGYHFNEEYQRSLRAADLRFLTIDDRNRCSHQYADFVLNTDAWNDENVGGSREPYTELLLGPKYALLRREFLSWNIAGRPISRDRLKLLITMGGSDPNNLTLRVIHTLTGCGSGSPEFEIKALVGGSNPHRKSLENAVERSDQKVSLVVDPNDVPRWMAWADVAITVAGNSVWELLFMGCTVLCCSRNEMDARFLMKLAAEQAIIDLGPSSGAGLEERLLHVLADASKQSSREIMAKNARAIVDGMGAQRVVEKLRGGVPQGALS